MPAIQPAAFLMPGVLQGFLSERPPLMFRCFLSCFVTVMLGLHRMCVGRMRGRGRKEKLHIAFCGFTHKRSKISPVCMISSCLWDHSCPFWVCWMFSGPVSSEVIYLISDPASALRRQPQCSGSFSYINDSWRVCAFGCERFLRKG